MKQKVFKILILMFMILSITACGLKKSNSNTNTKNDLVSDNNIVDVKQLTYHQMQELQNNNIIYFDFDKYDIDPKYKKILDQHANFLCINNSVQIIIEGHTDERGTSKYNIILGKHRANAVKMYLQSKGVNIEQINIVSYGKEKPAILGHDEISYSKNRRVVISY